MKELKFYGASDDLFECEGAIREYFMERVRYYREQSIQLPRASDPRYIEMAGLNEKK